MELELAVRKEVGFRGTPLRIEQIRLMQELDDKTSTTVPPGLVKLVEFLLDHIEHLVGILRDAF